MQGFIALVFSLFLLSSAATAATKAKVVAAPPTVSVKKAYTYCLLNGPIQNMRSGTIWATPVFEFEYDALEPVDPTGKHANAFYNQLGGGGEKSCGGVHASASEAQASRDNYQATMTRRMGLWKTKWIDVPYTPAPWAPSTLATGARVPQFLFCWAADMEPDVRKSVATNVLSITMPQMGDPAYSAEYTWYSEHFKQEVLLANGLPNGTVLCIYKDSFAEASESLNTYRKSFSGFNLRWVDVVWNPAGPGKVSPARPTMPKKPAAVKPAAPASQKPAAAQTTPAITDATPSLPKVLYGFCRHSGKGINAMSSVFRSDHHEKLTELAEVGNYYASLFEINNKARKYAFAFCQMSASQAVAFAMHSSQQYEIIQHAAAEPRKYAPLTMVEWPPATDASTLNEPAQGPSGSLFTACSINIPSRKVTVQTTTFQLSAADAKAQYEKVKRMNVEFQSHVAKLYPNTKADAAECFSADKKADVDGRTAIYLQGQGYYGYSIQNIEWSI